jgi:hypothetical protein
MPETKSAGSSKTTTETPKTDEDRDIENQSQSWGDKVKKLIFGNKSK